MSRSRPTDTLTNPATRWHEWNGEKGCLRYYDKDAKQNVDVPLPFAFLLLDQLGSVGGWHEPTQSGIYSNEVRDTRQDALVVKAFKQSQGPLIEGIYSQIKDRLATLGGQFVSVCYVAYKRDGQLVIGGLKFKGAALGAWMDFTKAHRADLYKGAVEVTGFTEGKKGRVIFRAPTFAVRPVSTETQHAAIALDEELQAYLTAYLARTTRDRVDTAHVGQGEPTDELVYDTVSAPTADDIPF